MACLAALHVSQHEHMISLQTAHLPLLSPCASHHMSDQAVTIQGTLASCGNTHTPLPAYYWHFMHCVRALGWATWLVVHQGTFTGIRRSHMEVDSNLGRTIATCRRSRDEYISWTVLDKTSDGVTQPISVRSQATNLLFTAVELLNTVLYADARYTLSKLPTLNKHCI